MGLKSYLTELLRLDARDEETKKALKQDAEHAAVQAVEDFFRLGLQIDVDPPRHLMTLPYWHFDLKTHAKGWIQRHIVDQIKENYSTLARSTVAHKAEEYFRSEEFMDRIIDRINRKQVRAGISLPASPANPATEREPEQSSPVTSGLPQGNPQERTTP